MPKHKAGHLSNLGGYATINTKRTKVRKTQKEEKENLNPVDLFLDAAKIIAQQESPLPPSIPALDKIFTTADCDHNSKSNEPEGAVHDAENICGLEYDSCEDDCEGSLDEDGDIFEAEALEDGIESEQGVRVDAAPGTCPEGPQSSTGLAWELQKAPEVVKCATALQDLRNILKPCWDTGRGYKDPALDNWTKGRWNTWYDLAAPLWVLSAAIPIRGAAFPRNARHARTLPALHDARAFPRLKRPIAPAIQKHPSTVHQAL
ncbi:hypothetical protein BD769DRAFT_1663756 [Suillus cothurnatus]|nr:hypothetical protein BD769DRAFT_1663756 [Suillus cothurnatus]